MKVILLQEIKGQGGEGDVVEVKRGYAVNYLFPKKLAIEASKGNLKQLELRKHNIAKRETERLDSADKIQAALADKVLVIGARVGEEGQLFGSVTTQQIADKLGEELGLDIDRRKIDLRAPIKTAGEHNVTVTIYRDIKAILTINVVSEAELVKVEAPEVSAAEGEADEAAVEAADELAEAGEIDESAAEAVGELAETGEVDEVAVEAADELAEADEAAEPAEVVEADEADDSATDEFAMTEELAEEPEAAALVEEATEQAEDADTVADLAEESETIEEAVADALETEETAEDFDTIVKTEDDLDDNIEQ